MRMKVRYSIFIIETVTLFLSVVPAQTEVMELIKPAINESSGKSKDFKTYSTDNAVIRLEGHTPDVMSTAVIIIAKQETSEATMRSYKLSPQSFLPNITLPFGKGLYRIILQVVSDHSGNSQVLNSAEFDIINFDPRVLAPMISSERVNSEDAEIITLARQLTAHLDNDRQKAFEIYRWTARNIKYDKTESHPILQQFRMKTGGKTFDSPKLRRVFRRQSKALARGIQTLVENRF